MRYLGKVYFYICERSFSVLTVKKLECRIYAKRRSKMDWTQFAIFLASMAGLFFWNRAESRNDVRMMQSFAEANRALIDAIAKEMKDFHGRLCALEERSRK
jgi:hypothetical protein